MDKRPVKRYSVLLVHLGKHDFNLFPVGLLTQQGTDFQIRIIDKQVAEATERIARAKELFLFAIDSIRNAKIAPENDYLDYLHRYSNALLRYTEPRAILEPHNLDELSEAECLEIMGVYAT